MANIQRVERKSPNVTDQAHALAHYAHITDVHDFNDLLDCYRQLKQACSPADVLLILDDQNQCAYTSMHAKTDDLLYFDADCDAVSKEAWDDCYANAALGELAHIEKVLLEHATPKKQAKCLQEIAQKTKYHDDEDWLAFCLVNENPMPVLLDDAILVKVAQVSGSAQKLAIMPNGYFSVDFSPYENHALMTVLCDEYGYELMGIGAALLGFVKTEAFQAEKQGELLAFLQSVYHFSSETLARLAEHIVQQDYLLLFYSESPSEYGEYYE